MPWVLVILTNVCEKRWLWRLFTVHLFFTPLSLATPVEGLSENHYRERVFIGFAPFKQLFKKSK